MTVGQLAMKQACLRNLAKKNVSIVEARHGAGLNFAIQNLIKYSPHVKLIYADALQYRTARKIFVSLLKDGMNVRFSNLNYLSVELPGLVRVVRERMNEDLKKENVLLIVDHIDVLNGSQLYHLARLVEFNKPPCAIVLRSTTEHRLKLARRNNVLHDQLYVSLTKDRNAFDMPSKEERQIFIRDVHQSDKHIRK